MVSLQIINKVLATNDYSIIENNLLTEDYFIEYEDEYNFIKEHVNTYGNVPDKETFISKFPDFEFIDVTESDRYLVETIREENLFYKSVPVVQKIAKLLKTDANAAAEYMIQSMKDLQPHYNVGGVDIISQAQNRYKQFEERRNSKEREWFFTTGFEELDDLIYGFSRSTAEFVVIVARTNMGKSWILEKMTTHIWQIGFDVGYISPEMDDINVGYRFDTLYKNFSNSALMYSNSPNDATVNEQDYAKYIEELQSNNHKFMVATPIDFDKKITVSKLRNWIKETGIQFLAIDGISYLTDERFKRGDTKAVTLTNISEDLRLLSLEMKIPIVVVIQSNRGGVKSEEEEGTPELENIKDSDGVSHNATKVLSLRQKDEVLEIAVKKNTFGKVGGKLKYQWAIDKGDFVFIPSYDDAEPEEKTEKKVKKMKKQYNDKEDVF